MIKNATQLYQLNLKKNFYLLETNEIMSNYCFSTLSCLPAKQKKTISKYNIKILSDRYITLKINIK